MSNKRNQTSWDKLSAYYQSAYTISLENYHYNPYGPGDNELHIIGDITGLDVLEVGCGGGQNSVVLAKRGAGSVTGVDQSETQLQFARRLAEEQGVGVQFIKGDMEDIHMVPDESKDLVVSSHAMNYASDIQAVFSECARVLRKGGRLVTCINHPVWIVLGDALQEDDFSKIRNYYGEVSDKWDWHRYKGEKIATFHSSEWRLGEILNSLVSAGLSLEHVDEPRGYSLDELKAVPPGSVPYVNSEYTPKEFIRAATLVPNSLIIKARKNG
jgi:ubiquinone/menaquinone biosynthesis C-methylase UbiE